jgi:hypothetical protein
MANMNELSGLAEVLKNFKEKQENLGKGCERGLKKAGLMLQRESQKLVPVNLGNLKASAFTRHKGEGFKTVVEVGYTASYALYVHEAVGMKLKGLPRTGPGAKGSYWDPQGQGQAKFLEEPARRLEPQVRKIVADEMNGAGSAPHASH